MRDKYGHVRIEAVAPCPACAPPDDDPAPVVGCATCHGTGETRTPLLLPGEPFFLVRGKDELAENVIAFYAVLFGRAHGLPPGEFAPDLAAKLADVVQWQEANPGLVKRPD